MPFSAVLTPMCFSFAHVLGMQHADIHHSPLLTALLTMLYSKWEVKKTSIG